MRSLILVTTVAFPGQSIASNATDSVMEACMKSKEIAICKATNDSIKNMERKVNNLLIDYGMKESAVILITTTKALIEQRINIKTGSWDLINLDRSVIKIEREKVYLQLEWNL